MARRPAAFPGADFGRATSSPVYQPNHSNDVPASATASVARAADAFGRRLGALADEVLTRKGEQSAVDDLRREREGDGEATFRGGFAKDDDAYNAILRTHRVTQRRGVFLEELAKVEEAHPDSPAAFGEAAEAVRAGLLNQPTGDARADAALNSALEQDLSTARVRVLAREQTRRRQVAAGIFTSTVSVQETVLGQAVASAPFDEAGGQRVGQALNGFIAELAQFGPRSAFTVAGVEFAADPSRQDAVSPEALARIVDAAQGQARISWIRNAQDQLTGSAAKAAFAGNVRERWAAGDPMFAGLNAAQMDGLGAELEGQANRAETDERAAAGAAAASARDLLRALEYGGDVDEAELRARAAASGDVGLQAEVDYRLTHGFGGNPGGGGGGGAGGVGVGFDGAASFLLDTLEGPGLVGNDNGRGRAQFGVTEASYPDAWRDGQVTRPEAIRVARLHWDAIGGDQLDPDLAIAALATAYVGGINGDNAPVRRFLREADGDVERFLALEMAWFESLAARDPAKYGDDLRGWRARQGRVRGAIAAQRAQRRSMEGYASDPVDFSRGNSRRGPLATVAEFTPAAVFDGGDAGRQWGAAIQQRLATARALSQRDGVPVRILDNAEAAFYKSAIEDNPANILPLAAAVGTALGPDARQFFDELGRAGVAGADLHLASLAMEPRNANVVRLALDGRAARAEGARAPDFGDEPSVARVVQASAAAWADQPGLTPAILSLAEDMAIGDAQRGRLQPPGAYVNSALGATNQGGRRYGGVVRVNGAVTVAPTWLEADRLDEALEIAARGWVEADRGPVYANGEPIPANRLAGYQLRAMPNGRYRLVDRMSGQVVAGRRGSAFEFDIESEAFRGLLSRRLPGAVLEAR